MKGNNTLRLNEATIMAALQMYFEATFAVNNAPKVLAVRQVDRTEGTLFEVQVKGKEEEQNVQ